MWVRLRTHFCCQSYDCCSKILAKQKNSQSGSPFGVILRGKQLKLQPLLRPIPIPTGTYSGLPESKHQFPSQFMLGVTTQAIELTHSLT